MVKIANKRRKKKDVIESIATPKKKPKKQRPKKKGRRGKLRKAAVLKQLGDGLINRDELAAKLGVSKNALLLFCKKNDISLYTQDQINAFNRIGKRYHKWEILQILARRYVLPGLDGEEDKIYYRLSAEPPEHLRYDGDDAVGMLTPREARIFVLDSTLSYVLARCHGEGEADGNGCGRHYFVAATDLKEGANARSKQCRECLLAQNSRQFTESHRRTLEQNNA